MHITLADILQLKRR